MNKEVIERLLKKVYAASGCGHISLADGIEAFLSAYLAERGKEAVYIVFDGPPDHDAPRFVEVETKDGKSVKVDGWKQQGEYCNLGPFFVSQSTSEDYGKAAVALASSNGCTSDMGPGYQIKGSEVLRGIVASSASPVPLFLAPQPAIPEGMALVPIEPTEAMIDAYCHGLGPTSNWSYMLKAAQEGVTK